MAPSAVLSASALQLLLSATFLIIPATGRRRGPAAQRAAESEVAKQGFAPEMLARHRINFSASAGSVLAADAIGVALAALAVLNLTGDHSGRILSWIFQPILLLLGVVIMPGEVFTTRYIQAAFRESGDAALSGIDVAAFVDAAARAYPGWLRPVMIARLVTATAGSLLVVVLLALPSAAAYFS